MKKRSKQTLVGILLAAQSFSSLGHTHTTLDYEFTYTQRENSYCLTKVRILKTGKEFYDNNCDLKVDGVNEEGVYKKPSQNELLQFQFMYVIFENVISQKKN